MASETWRQALDPEAFRQAGHRWVDRLAGLLRDLPAADRPVLGGTRPEPFLDAWPEDFPEDAQGGPDPWLERLLQSANFLPDPRYVGHQVAVPLPLAALCDMAASFLNNGPVVWEMGPAAMAMEKRLVAWMARMAGLGAKAGGLLTSGGSLGNLTALLAARQHQIPGDAWEEGTCAGLPPCVLVSREAHYSVARAVQIMGWGRQGALAVPVDEEYRMRPEALPEALEKARTSGRRAIGVVACACSTATGAFDPLEPIAAFCRKEGLWFHVDGAHGASVLLSRKYRPLLAGLESCDSLVWDAHKMMMMPALLTAVLFRDRTSARGAFAQKASYLFGSRPAPSGEFNIGQWTVECTKPMMAFKCYVALRTYGTALFGEHIENTFDLARGFAEELAGRVEIELPARPQANIVCFRYRPPGLAPGESLDALQERIRARLIEDSGFYLVQTRLPAGLFLRITVINPRTTGRELSALAEVLIRAGEALAYRS